jgi:hypothetical protein
VLGDVFRVREQRVGQKAILGVVMVFEKKQKEMKGEVK